MGAQLLSLLILIAVSDNHFRLLSSSSTTNTISACIQSLQNGEEWSLTSVYGPQGNQEKEQFITELKEIRVNMLDKWLIAGDFNLIYKAQDKNNNSLNRRLMGLFRQAIEELELIELNLHGRKFTWTNAQANPTMTRIDRIFCSTAWEETCPTSHLQALPSTLSDHCPLILQGDTQVPKCRTFRFEAYWVQMPEFSKTVTQAWTKPLRESDPVRRLHIKLERTAVALKAWQKKKLLGISNYRLRLRKNLYGSWMSRKRRAGFSHMKTNAGTELS